MDALNIVSGEGFEGKFEVVWQLPLGRCTTAWQLLIRGLPSQQRIMENCASRMGA